MDNAPSETGFFLTNRRKLLTYTIIGLASTFAPALAHSKKVLLYKNDVLVINGWVVPSKILGKDNNAF